MHAALRPRAFIFDAYGTLLDVHSVILRAGVALHGDLPALSALWRQKQLEYTWLRSLMERYEDFEQVTRAALIAAAGQLKIEATSAQLDALLQAYFTPAAFPDARPALERLQEYPVAILSNGTPAMLQAAVRHNGIQDLFTAILSVDRLKTYKPSPRVYALGPEALNMAASEILFVSSNAWDAAGAKAFGYRVCWCNRSGAPPEQLGLTPDMIVSSLEQLATAAS